MSTVKFEFASLRYLNLWIDSDRKIIDLVSSSNREDRLKAISMCTNRYSVQRSFRTEYDVDRGDDRYAPILEVLEQMNCEKFQNDPQQTVTQFASEISELYGNFNVLSGSTKILWMWFGRDVPIMIYDSQAKKALKTKTDDYGEFCSLWETRYQESRYEIERVCDALPKMYKYVSDEEFSNRDLIAELAAHKWFHRRVLDTFLWNQGG